MMLNKHYLGDSFYPAIIDKTTFDAVPIELEKRASKLGRLDKTSIPRSKYVSISYGDSRKGATESAETGRIPVQPYPIKGDYQ